jgi:hypothetical protein
MTTRVSKKCFSLVSQYSLGKSNHKSPSLAGLGVRGDPVISYNPIDKISTIIEGRTHKQTLS